MELLTYLIFFLYLYEFGNGETGDCNKGFKCVAISECTQNFNDQMIFPCHKGLNLICCSEKSIKLTTNTTMDLKKRLAFPVNCGTVMTENKVIGGETAELGQFPWMALLGYRQKAIDYTEFLCGGTLITDKYVLTAAHCIFVDASRELTTVRLGEHNIRTPEDCVVVFGVKTCADKPIDVSVEKTSTHPRFNNITLKNDVALIKLKEIIKFTNYVRPICLPFGRGLENQDFTGQKFIVSGWGKTNSVNLGGSPTLQFASVSVWNLDRCNSAIPPAIRNLSHSQLCANGMKEDACKGDSGGPLINVTLDLDGDVRYFQVGIVSFASSITCGIEELPPIYTRVDKFLMWITDVISF